MVAKTKQEIEIDIPEQNPLGEQKKQTPFDKLYCYCYKCSKYKHTKQAEHNTKFLYFLWETIINIHTIFMICMYKIYCILYHITSYSGFCIFIIYMYFPFGAGYENQQRFCTACQVWSYSSTECGANHKPFKNERIEYIFIKWSYITFIKYFMKKYKENNKLIILYPVIFILSVIYFIIHISILLLSVILISLLLIVLYIIGIIIGLILALLLTIMFILFNVFTCFFPIISMLYHC